MMIAPEDFEPCFWRGEDITAIVVQVAEFLSHGLVVPAGTAFGSYFGERAIDELTWFDDAEWQAAWHGLDRMDADDAYAFGVAARAAALRRR